MCISLFLVIKEKIIVLEKLSIEAILMYSNYISEYSIRHQLAKFRWCELTLHSYSSAYQKQTLSHPKDIPFLSKVENLIWIFKTGLARSLTALWMQSGRIWVFANVTNYLRFLRLTQFVGTERWTSWVVLKCKLANTICMWRPVKEILITSYEIRILLYYVKLIFLSWDINLYEIIRMFPVICNPLVMWVLQILWYYGLLTL